MAKALAKLLVSTKTTSAMPSQRHVLPWRRADIAQHGPGLLPADANRRAVGGPGVEHGQEEQEREEGDGNGAPGMTRFLAVGRASLEADESENAQHHRDADAQRPAGRYSPHGGTGRREGMHEVVA